MIDENFKPWLIEINTNPCLDTSSVILKGLIPCMIDQAFQIAIDPLFPPPHPYPSSRLYQTLPK